MIKWKYCGKKLLRNKDKCPALGKICWNCIYKRRIEIVDGTDSPKENAKMYAINTPTKTREKVKMNGLFFHMQVDRRSYVTLIPRNFWEKMCQPKLRKSNLLLKQFDGIVIKVMDTFEGIFETKKHFKKIPIMVAAWNKDHVRFEIDVLKEEEDTTKLMNPIKVKENNIRLFSDYRASIH